MKAWSRFLLAVLGLGFFAAGAFNLPESAPVSVALIAGAVAFLVLAIVPLEVVFRIPGMFVGKIREVVREEVEPIRAEVAEVHEAMAQIVGVGTIRAEGKVFTPGEIEQEEPPPDTA